ncbi:GNAT family N-acetyltransferase [Myroides marinus]|uniref:GNAT family N-acetyltransferase n=1 Tax=Myroides marinus TaxID=703342 RepID=UPI0025756772|nr:GNAT family N-acetyltransferase [Myroides marinus]MDM1347702.1 GNAT family N-acetyltransferase [Myroides marinus]MDM1351375.1 GNAT family N-acetyltransferase [Myroides marinus]MDM1354730.1 GNAT family N-acetyltransferase [Myroides marinus]MDM1358582.1 GNAT family N-acetyltransferase [Myroides marinus]MDM1365699.1 GNAT family N-acetyltransferase [Myroides marinus]
MRYIVSYDLIEPDDYINMRVTCGLSSKTTMAAVIGIANSLCCVSIYDTENDNKFIGMGRLVGDGGCHCQVVDICVLPEYQGQGLGKLVMTKLTEFINDNLPESCYVNLIADGEAHKLYAQYGFNDVWPASRGMGYTKKS